MYRPNLSEIFISDSQRMVSVDFRLFKSESQDPEEFIYLLFQTRLWRAIIFFILSFHSIIGLFLYFFHISMIFSSDWASIND